MELFVRWTWTESDFPPKWGEVWALAPLKTQKKLVLHWLEEVYSNNYITLRHEQLMSSNNIVQDTNNSLLRLLLFCYSTPPTRSHHITNTMSVYRKNEI
jgi:hypothetical protein